MIVDLCSSANNTLNKWDELNKIANQIARIIETDNALKELQKELENFCEQFSVLTSRIEMETVQSIILDCSGILNDIQESKNNFESQLFWQVTKINNQNLKLNLIQTKLEAAWTKYANEKIDPLHELLTRVFKLQEIKNQKTSIEKLTETLASQANSAPKSEEELKQFDINLKEFEKRLSNLQGLTENIQNFLKEVIAERFTVADLTDEILEWCQIEERGNSFKVIF